MMDPGKITLRFHSIIYDTVFGGVTKYKYIN
jgi:hypothetical protein